MPQITCDITKIFEPLMIPATIQVLRVMFYQLFSGTVYQSEIRFLGDQVDRLIVWASS